MANANAMFWLSRIKHEDAYTAEHCLRVGILAIAFARFLGLPKSDMETLGLCGLLHDIGKMKIPGEILNKPGALTSEEMAVMKRHTSYGYDLLSAHHQLEPIIRDAALSHHERLDGRGYPNGVPEWKISRFARIIAIVDAYDAITSDRCYQDGRSPAKALRILYRERFGHFDAELTEAFIRMVGIYPPGSLVELNSGEVAIVLSTNPQQKLRPKVELILDSEKQPCEPTIIDLTEQPLTPDGEVYGIAQAVADNSHGFDLEARIEKQVRAFRREHQPQRSASATPTDWYDPQ